SYRADDEATRLRRPQLCTANCDDPMRTLSKVVCSSLVALLAVACTSASYTKIQNEQKNPEFKDGPGKKTPVLVATADAAMRQDVETQFAIEGVTRKIDLTASHRLVPDFKEMTKERLAELVKEGS